MTDKTHPYYTVHRVVDVSLSGIKALPSRQQQELALGRIIAGMRRAGVTTAAMLREADNATNHYADPIA